MADMGSDGRVVFELTADDKKLVQGLNDATKKIQTETGKWDKAGTSSANNVGNAWTNMLKKLATGAAAAKAAQMLAKLGMEAINLASDLEEVQNVVDVTFGDDASKIETWAKNAGKQFGLTETQAKRFTSTLGAMLKSAGLTGAEVTSMSTDLAGLAADMASFYNLDFDTAFDKIRSGISGQTEPLKQLGINLSESNLSAFAEEQGKVYSQLSETEKIILRYQYLMKATADAQGDFERTSDGFANQMRLLETNLTALKTNIGEYLLPVVNQAVIAINTLFSILGKTAPTTLLDTFAGIDAKTAEKTAGIEATADKARALIETLQALSGNGGENGEASESGDGMSRGITRALDSMGALTSETSAAITENAEWLSQIDELTKLIPGLSSIIDVNTGAIEGGWEAVKDYVEAWEEASKLDIFNAAMQEKVSAYDQARADLSGLQFEAMWRRRLADNEEEAFKKAIAAAGEYVYGDQTLEAWAADYLERYAITNKRGQSAWDAIDPLGTKRDLYNAALTYFNSDARRNADEAERTYIAQAEAIDQIAAELEAAGDALADYSAGLRDTTYYSTELEAAIGGDKTAVSHLQALLQAVADTAQQIADIHAATWDETAKSVDSVVKGFEEFITPAQKARAELEKLDAAALKYNEDGTLSEKWTNAQGNIPTMSSMMQSMQQQIDYMQQYEGFLATLRANGVAEDILAQFADGSMENFDILETLASNPTQIADWVALYRQREAAKQGFTGVLTDYKLLANDEYQGLVATEANMVDQLDMAVPAEEASSRTVEGIVNGIKKNLDALTTEVDAVIAQFARLDALGGYGFGNGIGGGFGYNSSKWGSYGLVEKNSNAVGLDYVPFDGYLASLHQGESILNAEEAALWRDMQYRSGGIDYDTLGGVMRDNAAGNVYMDGRTVGRLISASQADSYRGLERSGWRG